MSFVLCWYDCYRMVINNRLKNTRQDIVTLIAKESTLQLISHFNIQYLPA